MQWRIKGGGVKVDNYLSYQQNKTILQTRYYNKILQKCTFLKKHCRIFENFPKI